MIETIQDLKEIPVVSKAQMLWGKLFTEQPQELLEVVRLQSIYGNIYLYYKFLTSNIYVLSGSEEIAHVHVNEHNYIKRYNINPTFTSLLGEGMLLNSGDKYYDRRKNILPLFKIAKLHEYVGIMQQVADSYIDLIKQDIQNQKSNKQLTANKAVINIEKYTTHLCLDIAALILFNKSWGEDIERAGEIIKYLNENYTVSKVQVNKYYQINKRLHCLKEIIKRRFVDAQDVQNKGVENLITHLYNYQGNSEHRYTSENEIFHEIITLLLTGHETSAITVSFALAVLSLDKSYEELVLSEIHSLNQDVLTYDDIQRCHYTRMWLEETMRLFPPVWATMRYNLNHDEINGYYLPAKSYIISNLFALHRNPEYWHKPNVFDPFRFSAENKAKQVKNSYLPFILGPRSCAASNFSMLELQVIVIRLMQQLRFEKIPGTQLTLAPYMTLRSEPELTMYVSEY